MAQHVSLELEYSYFSLAFKVSFGVLISLFTIGIVSVQEKDYVLFRVVDIIFLQELGERILSNAF